MDMLNADLQLKNDAFARKKSKTKASDEDDASFHFIAFVPVQGKVWKLDGLERQPQNLAPEIESRMAQYEDGQIEFAILALVKEPLTTLVAALAENVKSITSASQRLGQLKSDWKYSLADPSHGDGLGEQDVILGPCEQYRLDQEAIDRAMLGAVFKVQLETKETSDLLALRQELITAQAGLRASIRDEAMTVQADNQKAASRRNDKGVLAKGLLQVLERMGKSRSALECNEPTSIYEF
ncbi:MAG: hypothetical protein Q9179_000908 [Wetmoreana sp. 5 TL-2023]